MRWDGFDFFDDVQLGHATRPATANDRATSVLRGLDNELGDGPCLVALLDCLDIIEIFVIVVVLILLLLLVCFVRCLFQYVILFLIQ